MEEDMTEGGTDSREKPPLWFNLMKAETSPELQFFYFWQRQSLFWFKDLMRTNQDVRRSSRSSIQLLQQRSVLLCVSPDLQERSVIPLRPGITLYPTSVLSVKQSQINSAVGLLEFYCYKHFLSPPQYHLFSTHGLDGQLLLLYKVCAQTR